MKVSKFGFFVALSLFFNSFAQAAPKTVKMSDLNSLAATILTSQVLMESRAGLNWGVGEHTSYNVTMALFGITGTMTKVVHSDEGNALWIYSEQDLMGQKQAAQMLMSKSDGKILKMLVNGQEQTIPANTGMTMELQEAASVTVPAGTFQCIHIVAKSDQYSKIEGWINPRDTVMDGTLKQVMTTNMGDVMTELTAFGKN